MPKHAEDRDRAAAIVDSGRSPALDAHLAAVAEIATEAIISIDAAQQVVFFNEGAERIFGYPRDLVLGRPLDMLLPAESRATHVRHVEEFAASPVSARRMGERMEISGLRRGGEQFPAEASITKTRVDGELRFTVVLRDITENKLRAEQAARLVAERSARSAAEAAERRMSFLATASAELASSLDYERTLRTIARLAVPDIADWAAVDIVTGAGRVERLAVEHIDPAKVEMVTRLQERFPPDPDAQYGAAHVIRTGASELLAEIPAELLVEAAVNEEHLALLRTLDLRSYLAAPLIAHGQVLGAITFVYAESGRSYGEQDLALAEDLARRAAIAIHNARLVGELEDTRERLEEQAGELELQAEELASQYDELEATTEALRVADRARRDFMATVSHELRTPLNAVLGYAQLLTEGVPARIPEPAVDQVERIRLSARHLLQVIDEILTFSRLESGPEPIEVADIDVNDLVDEIRAIIEPIAAERGLTFHAAADAGGEPLRTDPRKVRQVLLNLLGNAIKFTDDGGVELRVSRNGTRVEFEVSDTGIGIAATEQQRIFEPFWQADQSKTRRAGGTGLGLAITDRFVRMLGGTIAVRSAARRGSTFVVSLPAVDPSAALPPDR